MSIALFGEITLKDGKVQQHNFDDYPVLRIHQTPKMIHTIIQDPLPIVVEEYKKRGGDVPPTGVGEPPTGGAAGTPPTQVPRSTLGMTEGTDARSREKCGLGLCARFTV
jgi:hypothetical protein